MTKDKSLSFDNIDSSVIILGFTGPIGSGSTFIAQSISAEYNRYKYYKLSQIIKEGLVSKGITNPTVDEMQDEGNRLRLRSKMNSILVRKTFEKINKEAKKTEISHILIDGIKNSDEIMTLKAFPNFYLFSVHAKEEIRRKRCISPKSKRFKSEEDFNKADKRDQDESFEYGQQVKKCSDLSDIIILNDNDIPKANEIQKRKLIHSIYDKYIKLIENSKEGKDTPDRIPSVDEFCMTISYILSKRSNCMKRKVGALIIDSGVPLIDMDRQTVDCNMIPLPQIIASGYNEVPNGSFPCRYLPSIEKCYRDYLQEEHAKKIQYCPNCGKKMRIKLTCYRCKATYDNFTKYCTECNSEIEDTIKCKSCGKDIFLEYLPGNKNTPGKLLDMCRSLHAEENCILSLINSNRTLSGELILYVTTQPCNLCANKIVIAGIKRVCFAEPYLMKESAEILERAHIDVRRFEGVKSSAYFKFYH